MVAIVSWGRPHRPTDLTFTDELWEVMQHCWHWDPHFRPGVLEVLQVLLGT